ncbi:hypothetical protein DFH28DRAFT_1077640 [Melampsora americana]|nr:hypothetical protein DFH28DRAFT_1077640 [Melampsora americana]
MTTNSTSSPSPTTSNFITTPHTHHHHQISSSTHELNHQTSSSSSTTPTTSSTLLKSAVPILPNSNLNIKSPPLPVIPSELLQALARPPIKSPSSNNITNHKQTDPSLDHPNQTSDLNQSSSNRSKLKNILISSHQSSNHQNKTSNELDLSSSKHQLSLPEFTPVSTHFNVDYEPSDPKTGLIDSQGLKSPQEPNPSDQSNPNINSHQSNRPSTVKNLLNLVNFHSNKPSMDYQHSPSSTHTTNLQTDQSNAHNQLKTNSQGLEHQSSQSSFVLLSSTSQQQQQQQSTPNQTSKPFPQFPSSDQNDQQMSDSFQSNQTMPHTTPKHKETIWNKIGFSHTPFSGTSNSTSTSTGAKKLTLKQHQHHLADIPIDSKLRDPNHPHSASPLSSNYSSLASSSATRPRASFSLDHYIQSHLSSSHLHQQNDGKHHKVTSQRKSSNKDSNQNLNKSKPSGSSLISSKQSSSKSTDHLLDSSTLSSLQLATQKSSIHPTQHAHQSSIDHKSQNSTLSQIGNHQADWSSANSLHHHQDDTLEEDMDEVPWPRHENFTHHLHASHRRDNRLKDLASQHVEEDEEAEEDDDDDLGEEDDEEEGEDEETGDRRKCLDCALDDCKEHFSPIKPHARRMHLSSTGSADSPHIGQYLQLEHPSASTSQRHPARLPPSQMVNRLSPESSSSTSNSLPFRIGKGTQQTTFDHPCNSLRNRRILDPLEMRFKAITEPIITSTPNTGQSAQSSLYHNTLEVPHTAPIGGFPDPITASSTSTSVTANLTSPGTEETDQSSMSPRVRSLSDTLVHRAKQFHKIHHQLQHQYPILDRPHLDDLGSIDSHHLDIFNGTLKNASVSNQSPQNIKEEAKVGSDYNNDDELHFIDTPASRAALASKADFTIGVAGPKGVGKSTIITRALRKPLTNSVTLYSDPQANKIISYVSQVTNGNAGPSRTVQVLEVDQLILSERFIKKDHNKEGMIWPKRLPALDGILLCYDAMDPTALDHLRPLLHSFWTRGGISLIVLACKSNKDEKLNLTSPIKAAELVNVYGTGMIQLDGGLEDPGKKMRNSFNWIMKAIREARGEPRSYSSASTHILESSSLDDHEQIRSSFDSVTRSQSSDPSAPPPKLQADGAVKTSDKNRSEENENTEEANEKAQNDNDEDQATTANFGTMSNDATSRHAAQKAIVMSQRGSEMDLHLDKQTIIDKFVFATVSGNEPSFVDHFLIVFRRFSTPFDVLSALINRFEFVSYHLEDDPLLTRYAQMNNSTPSNTRLEEEEDEDSTNVCLLQQDDLTKSFTNPNQDTRSSIGLKSQTASSSIALDSKSENKSLLDCSNQVLGLSDEALALQITRLEWDIFAEMKPRHLIRYVLAPRDPKNPRVALRDPNSPIARSTDYLNHLAAWASSMILIQDKLKARARVLLKLMKVAYELRDMDDFHSLMGVLAGIEAQPVYRLEATFEIVQQMDLQSYRRYLSLKRLMSSQRSFSAYRLARQTASAQCVPYLGTYLQDITAVNEVKDDMRDGKVNWTKFGQIAKACSNVIECGKLAPEIEVEERIEGLIMRSPILSEDSQYALSYKWKHRAGGNGVKNNGTSSGNGNGVVRSKIISTSQSNNNSPLIGGGGGGGGGGSGASMMVNTSSTGPSTGVAKKGTRKLRQLINTAIHQ